MTANEKNFLHIYTAKDHQNPGISFSWIVILVKNLRNLARKSPKLPLFMAFVRDPKEPHPILYRRAVPGKNGKNFVSLNQGFVADVS